jgi:hypothetical protein
VVKAMSPTPAQRAQFDQHMAAAHDAVNQLVTSTRARNGVDIEDLIVKHLSYEIPEHLVRLSPSHDAESAFGAAMGLLIAAVLQLAGRAEQP